MNTSAPARPAEPQLPKDFNLWCALNSRPFRMIQHVWPDGSTEWDIEAFPGQPDATTAYGTGESDPVSATRSAFAFIAGLEWGETLTRTPEDAEEEEDSASGSPDAEKEAAAAP